MGEARSFVPAVADAANGMIYEEEGRSASTSKGRPTRAGRMFSTTSLNTVRYASTVYLLYFFVVVAFVLMLYEGGRQETFLISRATAGAWNGK